MHTGSASWSVSRAALLALAITAGIAPGAQGAEKDDAAPVLVPDGGRIVQQGDRLDLYDAKSNRIGYGYARPDGSVDLFNRDGSRRATITPGIGGGPARVTMPRGRRR